MLRKLKILMLLATMVAKSLSAPSKIASSLPKHPRRLQALEGALKDLEYTTDEFLNLVENTDFILGKPISGLRWKLMNALQERDRKEKASNMVVSPFSIHIIMMMFYLASEKASTTHQQLAKALELNDDFSQKYLLNAYQITEVYKMRTPGLEMANNIFIGNRFTLNLAYLRLIYGFFGVEPAVLDPDDDLAVKQINDFVKENTNELIKNLALPGSIGPYTKVVAVNAVHHSGDWRFKFDEDRTGPMEFTLLNGDKIIYNYGMRLKSGELRTAALDDSTVLELPYEDPNYIMYIIMPKRISRGALEEAARGFDQEEVERELEKHPDGLKVLLPKFTVGGKTNLIDIMKGMGVTELFDDRSNLKHLTPLKLWVTGLTHESTVEVNEKGSTAAAGTDAAACVRSSCDEFVADRAFAFIIMDTERGNELFAGVLVDPRRLDKTDALPIGHPPMLPIAANKTN